jgi:hypothetical protein
MSHGFNIIGGYGNRVHRMTAPGGTLCHIMVLICTEQVWVAACRRTRAGGVLDCPQGDDVAGDDTMVRGPHDGLVLTQHGSAPTSSGGGGAYLETLNPTRCMLSLMYT